MPHKMPVAAQVMTTKNVFRCCQRSLGRGRINPDSHCATAMPSWTGHIPGGGDFRFSEAPCSLGLLCRCTCCSLSLECPSTFPFQVYLTSIYLAFTCSGDFPDPRLG